MQVCQNELGHGIKYEAYSKSASPGVTFSHSAAAAVVLHMQDAYISEVLTLHEVKLLGVTLSYVERRGNGNENREPGYDRELDDKMLKGSYRR